MIEEKIITRIAELYYIKNIDQKEIARQYNFSKTKVCRLIKKAKESGMIEFKLKSPISRDHKLKFKYVLLKKI
jgi:DNA-binding transcriptional regulator LsrR (DeoR family)